MGSLPEKRSKATGASLRTTRSLRSVVRPPPTAVRPPAPGIEVLNSVSGTHERVCVMAVKPSTSIRSIEYILYTE
jgi:hypothetical protein